MRIRCDKCKKPIKLQRAINTEKFDGEVLCQNCETVWHVKLVKSKLEGYKYKRYGIPELSADELLEAVRKAKPESRELMGERAEADNVPESGT